jgi:toxin ParE1/3/4
VAHRVAGSAATDLDEIWFYIASESGSTDVADRVIDAITERFCLLADYPRLGRQRPDLRAGLRSYRVGDYLIFYRIEAPDVLILRVLHSRRDIRTLIGA